MAQRTIHYLVGELIRDDHIKDVNRFRIGSILPDAYTPTGKYPDVIRQLTHFEEYHDDTIYYHYERFVECFKDHMDDDLYLGYYMHLVEDMYWRKFWKENDMESAKTFGDIEVIHHDYHMMNEYIVKTYGLEEEIVGIEHFEKEAINEVFAYHLDTILADLHHDFNEHVEGEFVYLTPSKLDIFIKEYVPYIKEAYEAICKGIIVPSITLPMY